MLSQFLVTVKGETVSEKFRNAGIKIPSKALPPQINKSKSKMQEIIKNEKEETKTNGGREFEVLPFGF